MSYDENIGAVQVTLSVPKTQDIATIVTLFERHFFRDYKGFRGASRLPVLAIHAIYTSLVPELKRFQGCSVRPLNEHSDADSQTGSIGDIEVAGPGRQHVRSRGGQTPPPDFGRDHRGRPRQGHG
jgi:hypothetical protein